jgi:peroxiredoxin
MKKLMLAAVAASVMLASPAFAALAVGAKAPSFSAAAAEAGKETKVDLAAALKKGPVVLYFYPAAFTKGCTIEAHEFATHIAEFKALGASVIGVSGDDIEQLKKFSADPESCANAFPVAAASPEQIATFDVAAAPRPDAPAAAGPATRSSRTSYVIAPDGTILLTFSDGRDPAGHVTQSLDAVKTWRASHK